MALRSSFEFEMDQPDRRVWMPHLIVVYKRVPIHTLSIPLTSFGRQEECFEFMVRGDTMLQFKGEAPRRELKDNT
jgi:hypothetical protein